MPVPGPLPQTGDNHDINTDADNCFRVRKPKDWRIHSLEGTDDYGLDYQIQTTPGQRVTDVFRVQLKGTRSPKLSADGSFISIDLQASTVRFYARIVEPLLLVVCDLSVDPEPVDCQLYYVWMRDELHRINVDQLDASRQTVTVRVPTANRLRGADLSADIHRQNELSHAGHAINVHVEHVHPGMKVEDRVGVVRGLTRGIGARGASFIDALAAPAEDHWINPAANSLAWHLVHARDLMRTMLLARAAEALDAASAMLEGATDLERAEYWYQKGRWLTARGNHQEASAAFQQAQAANPHPRNLAAWTEAEVRVRYRDEGEGNFDGLLEALTGGDPEILAARSRVLAARRQFEESIAEASKIPGAERHAARALAFTMFSKPEEALADCDAGLTSQDLRDNTRQMLVVLRARALFSLAEPAALGPADAILPPSGRAGIDPVKIKAAWEGIEQAVELLRDAGWGSNIGLIADIWAGTASILGKQSQTLPAITEAARVRAELDTVQSAMETLAAQCGDFNLALEANDRTPPSQLRNLRRTLLLHEAQKHGACIKWFDENYSTLDRGHKLFGHAVTVATLSAHRLARPELVSKWAAELESTPELHAHAAILRYFLTIELNKLGSAEALAALLAAYEELSHPFDIGVALLQELDPTDAAQAAKLLDVFAVVHEKVEPSQALAMHVGVASVTMKRWGELLALCVGFKARVDAGPRMRGFEALALDQLGRTGEARELLQQMLDGGVADSLALNTYVNIMVRCGYADQALQAAEAILEGVTSDKQRKDCLRLLFNLVHNSDPSSARLLSLAAQFGGLADRQSEVEEGVFLVMYLIATLAESNAPAPGLASDAVHRADTFFAKFPRSNILRRGSIRNDSTGEEVISQLRELIGQSHDQETFRQRTENLLQQGRTAMPFAWRPKLVLSTVHDVVDLWEIAKASGRDDRKLHLTMVTDVNWSAPSAEALRARTPLLDITALLVLMDLGLIEKVIEFFGRIAVAKSTLSSLAQLVHPISGSPQRRKCQDLQDALKPHLAKILQPSALVAEGEDGLAEGIGTALDLYRERREVIGLCTLQGDPFRLYSDDLVFRAACAEGASPDGICTLDVLAALVETGALSEREKAAKVAMLCEWRIGLVVVYEDLLSLVPDELSTATSVAGGIAVLDKSIDFTSTVSALWDFRSPFENTLSHAAAVLRRLLDDTEMSDVSIAAIMGQWYTRAGLKNDAPPAALQVLTKPVSRAAAQGSLSKRSAARLWGVFLKLVEHHHGTQMDEGKEREAFRQLGAECAKLHATGREVSRVAFEGLRATLTEDTNEHAVFSSGYSDTLVRLAAQGVHRG